MKKYIGHTLYELSFIIPELKTYVNSPISAKDVAEMFIIIEENNPFPEYELMNTSQSGFIFKLRSNNTNPAQL